MKGYLWGKRAHSPAGSSQSYLGSNLDLPLTEPRLRRPSLRNQPPRRLKERFLYACIAFNLYIICRCYFGNVPVDNLSSLSGLAGPCPAPLPTLFSQHPPSPKHPAVRLASKSFDKTFTRFNMEKGLDSAAIAIVTSTGVIYEAFRGPLRANETSYELREEEVDRNSIYRIGSVSKMLACLQTMILRNRGALNLDDPISKYIPELDYRTQAHSPFDKDVEVITFRQLMSHMSGLGRDQFDRNATGEGPRDDPIPSFSELFDGLAHRDLVATPYTYPIYSNLGFALLGAANLAATQAMEGKSAPDSFEALIKRDVFDRLGMNHTSFLVNGMDREHLVIPSTNSEGVDLDLKALNSAGGVFSSLSDLTLLAQSFLNSSSEGALLPPMTMLEWLKPLYTFWDGFTSVGMPWEMIRTRHAFGRMIEEYTKGGSLASQFSIFTLIPSHSFAVIALTTSKDSNTLELHRLAMDYFLPAFDQALIEEAERNLAGTWKRVHSSDDRYQSLGLDTPSGLNKERLTSGVEVELKIIVSKGSLYATRIIVNGTDVLINWMMKKVPIWSLGNEEFRFVPQPPQTSESVGCAPGWINLDGHPYMNGYAMNLLRLVLHPSDSRLNELEIPSLRITLRR